MLRVKERVIAETRCDDDVKALAQNATPAELRQALSQIGWQGPIYKATSTSIDLSVVEATWSNIMQGLARWHHWDKEHFAKRVLTAVERHREQVREHLHYLNLCKWVECEACKKWRRCAPEYLETLRPTLDGVSWTCATADRVCEEEEDVMEDGEVWDGEVDNADGSSEGTDMATDIF